MAKIKLFDKMAEAGWMSWPIASCHTAGERPVEAIKKTETYRAFKEGKKAPDIDETDALPATLVFSWRRKRLAVFVNREQGLIQNRGNGKVAYLCDVPKNCLLYRE